MTERKNKVHESSPDGPFRDEVLDRWPLSAQRSVRAACVLADDRLAKEVQTWLHCRLDRLRLEVLREPSQLTLLPGVRGGDPGYQLLVLDEAGAAEVSECLRALHPADRPEVVLVGLSSLAALRLRERVMPFAIEVPEQGCPEEVGSAIQHALTVRLPLRALSRDLVGRLDLPEVLSLMRYHLVAGALARGRTKRAAAQLLGVTRPAVQQMVKSIASLQEVLGVSSGGKAG
ncbi:MAG: hypothetical protein OXU20_03670 [Myxococcales bacterium]|nr:hypothetical protein [Myxococcales bacterium]MDD9969925.1 hypothetical protein [Myxococcales bacterium]